ncbi:hypothetical protein B0T10DRAFT_454751 [Thelonectria olida]|uniref:Uncharacterized protein n=1 Tax=Thelonectria olida TaxID=1576542 RepID=A0A9P8WE12_9HYPO|nr:hypothetical protein B0T10DRAFT_454751 [Thelonectria olida]
MQLRGLLFLGLVLGTEGSNIARFRAAAPYHKKLARQASDTDSSNTDAADPTSTAVAVVTATSTVADAATTSQDTSDSSTTQDAGGSSGGSSDSGGSSTSAAGGSSDADTTVTRTVTVTDANADTITKATTVMKTVTSTVLVTSTAFKTDTVTSSGETATSTVYETSTQWANEKRALDLAPRTVGEDGIVIAEPVITQAPQLDSDDEEFDLLRPRDMLAKRDTVTVTTTVTVGDDSGKTVTNAVTRTVISTTSSQTKITKTITETEQADASTTVTVTSTLVITSTRVTTNVVQTATVAPSGSYGSDGNGGDDSSSDNSGSSSSSSSGLSTGAKAGIGAGAGVGGLIVLGLVLWCCFRKRNKPSKSELDDMFGSSEVPVGPGPVRDSSARLSSHMSQVSPTIPNVSPAKVNPAPEGYRGTALGDGRSGYAKPKPFGAAYAPAVSPEGTYSRTATVTSAGDERMDIPPNAVELGNDGNNAKWSHPEAAEIDGNQVTSPHGSAPPDHVYEMPSQQYR